MPFDSRDFRSCLGRFATGVTVVTARTPLGEWEGITVNSFTSVSLEPPLILFCVDRATRSHDRFRMAENWYVTILSREQEDLSGRFAARGGDKWKGNGHAVDEDGVPYIPGGLARLRCVRHAVADGGDHSILIGRVTRLTKGAPAEPLLYFDGGYRGVTAG